VTLLITDSFYSNGAIFNKGAVYNEAFSVLSFKDEICILDCDCFIPDTLGEFIKYFRFDKNIMYASRRIIVPKISDFINLLIDNNLLF
jgi:hypothetical protein